jgi:hypothetical protein
MASLFDIVFFLSLALFYFFFKKRYYIIVQLFIAQNKGKKKIKVGNKITKNNRKKNDLIH